MSDRRLTPFSGRIAHISLQDSLAGAVFTQGEAGRITSPLAALCAAPGGAIDRQLIYGERITVIERRDGHAFVMAEKDGYCGWIAEAEAGEARPASHRICVPASHLYPAPKVQATPPRPLYLNAFIEVLDQDDSWARTPEGYIPARHLRPLREAASDPATVAESLLHSPYLWGGNSAAGVDCSGLVQLSLHAAGLACPGDSDQQQAIGAPLPEGAPLCRGDLLFWRGHVAMMTGPDQLIHANGYTMSVAFEPLAEASARISRHYGGGILARRRPQWQKHALR